jgi:FkbM family methyltransferase
MDMFSLCGWTLSCRIRLQRKIKPLVENKDRKVELLKTYSQHNEDIILYQLFYGKTDGYYIDIGANDPVALNNTKKFYDLGWKGINVEPNPRLYDKICKHRPNDININCGVGDVEGVMIFYEVDPDVYSTFDENEAAKTRYSSSKKVVNKIPINITTINNLFDMSKQKIDLLSIDTEGFDYKILSMNNWSLNRPKSIVVELNHDENNSVYNLLTDNKYELIYFNGTNGIFVD